MTRTPGRWLDESDHAPEGAHVLIEKPSVPVVVPPNACSQFYEQWTGGRCQRRCDGIRELSEDVPCPCGPDPAGKKARG